MFAISSPALFAHTKTPFEHFKEDVQRYCASIGAEHLKSSVLSPDVSVLNYY
jgi:hypothetical protein